MSAQTWLEMSRRLLKNIHAYKCWNAVVPHQKHPLSPPSPNVRVGYKYVMWRWLDLDFSVPNISYRSHINLHLRRAIKKLKRAKLASFSSTLCRREIFVWFAARTLQLWGFISCFMLYFSLRRPRTPNRRLQSSRGCLMDSLSEICSSFVSL